MIYRHHPYLDLSDLMAALLPGAGRAELEAAVAERVNAHYAVAFAYAHAGLIACLRAAGLGDAEVVLPAYTCSVVADAVVASGNRPVFADIKLADYNMSLDALRAALTPHTGAIIATHMYGYPTDVDAIREAAGGDGTLIIEDRALGWLAPHLSPSSQVEGVGLAPHLSPSSQVEGVGPASTPGRVGLRGDVGLFSLGTAKHLFTVQGGVVATNSAELYERLRQYRDREMAHLPAALWAKRWVRLLFNYVPFARSGLQGLRTSLRRATTPNLDAEDSHSASSLVARDYATRMADFQARVGLCQLRKLDRILARRQELAVFYDRALRDIPGLTPAPMLPGANYSHYTMRVAGRDAIGFRHQMWMRGVEVGQVYDHVLPFRERFRPYARGSYPNTERATREVVNLPIHPRVKISEAQYIAQSVRHILQNPIWA
jgi:dTDP-4-amino-4,6-dideoxygalactose transaminase